MRKAAAAVSVGMFCYVAVCSAAQSTAASTGQERGGGIPWRPAARLQLVYTDLQYPRDQYQPIRPRRVLLERCQMCWNTYSQTFWIIAKIPKKLKKKPFKNLKSPNFRLFSCFF